MGGKVASQSSHITGQDRVIIEVCSLISMNQSNVPYQAESVTTLPPVILSLPATTIALSILHVRKIYLLAQVSIKQICSSMRLVRVAIYRRPIISVGLIIGIIYCARLIRLFGSSLIGPELLRLSGIGHAMGEQTNVKRCSDEAENAAFSATDI